MPTLLKVIFLVALAVAVVAGLSTPGAASVEVIAGVSIVSFILGLIFGGAFRKPALIEPPVFIACPHCSEPVRNGVNVCKTCHRTIGKPSTAEA